MEFVIRSKNTITACDNCHRAKRKCSGTMPCELCVQRGRTCVISASRLSHKRKIIFMGPESYEVHSGEPQQQQQQQQQQSRPTPNNNEASLWFENERLKTIESMLKLRGWMKPLLDYTTLTNMSNRSNSLPIQIQTICMAANMARYNGFYDSAKYFSDMATELSNQLFGEECSTDVAAAFMMLADATPKRFKYFVTCARHTSKQLAVSNVRDSRLHTYIYLTSLVFSDLSTTDVRGILSQYEKQVNERKFPTEMWDVMSMLVLRVLAITLTKFGFFYSDVRDAVKLCHNVRNSVFSKAELDTISADLQMFEFIMDSNIDKFGREFFFWYKSMQLLITWKRGETAQAYVDAMQYLTILRDCGRERAFLMDITMYTIPLLILHEIGLQQPVKEAIDYLSTMFHSTEQYEISSVVIPYFVSTTAPRNPLNAPSPNYTKFQPAEPLNSPTQPPAITTELPPGSIPFFLTNKSSQATFLDTQSSATFTTTSTPTFQSVEPQNPSIDIQAPTTSTYTSSHLSEPLSSPADAFSTNTTDYIPTITPQSNYSPSELTPQTNCSPIDPASPSNPSTETNLSLPTDIPFYEVPNSPYLSFSFNNQ